MGSIDGNFKIRRKNIKREMSINSYTFQHGGAIPEVLQKIVLPALSRSQCESLFININPITERMFCAGDLQGLGDSCNGDSGGPLVTLKNVQYGLVSWGLDCAMNGFTGVYTYLPYFRNWIEQNRR